MSAVCCNLFLVAEKKHGTYAELCVHAAPQCAQRRVIGQETVGHENKSGVGGDAGAPPPPTADDPARRREG
jgi:hypothetical protein